ncbi:glycine zipper family protein [Crocosphaera sp. XPORK-15E]|uniref:glycine zipper family protein n=1 Tax=Crocosphaera sp. XPORK-15E TaxID=3110247 RepID=UPI002B211531|nr:glycine zipper family protein [Crocosphaera sp. XPORK-15E]MEA5532561.1 glycine zipper family protein [Crocosphaera sp. XPORK-15E]
MKRIIKGLSLTLVSSVLFTDLTIAQSLPPEPFAYPTKEQTPQQQEQDHYACYSWAKEQTGVDPSQLSAQTTAQSSQQGTVLRTTGKASLLGVVGGAIGGNVGEGAAIGAGVGALAGLFKRREEQQQATQATNQAAAQEQQKLQTYYRAWTACMEGRGYTVK